MTQQDDITQRLLTDDEINDLCGWRASNTTMRAENDRALAREVESAVLSKLRAPVADERDIWLVCLSREYYNGGDRPVLAVPTEAMAQQIAADLQQYCRDLRERLDANNWQHEADPDISAKLYEESEALFAAARFPHGVKLERYDLDDGFSFWPLALIGASTTLASAPVDPEATEVDFLVRVFEELDTWRAEDWNELLERRPSILALLRPLVLASAPVAGEAIYQIKLAFADPNRHAWRDVPIETFREQPETRRRVVYAAPQASAETAIIGLSERDRHHVREFINCDGLGSMVVEGPRYSAVVRALKTQADKDGGQQRAGDVDERAAFEASGITQLIYRSTEPGYTDEYQDSHTQFAWRGWKARAALSAPQAEQGERDAD